MVVIFRWLVIFNKEKSVLFSEVVAEATREKSTAEKEGIEHLDMQKAFQAVEGTEFSKGSTGGAKAKGRGAR